MPRGSITSGSCINRGEGVAKDLTEAQRWFTKAAEAYPPGTDRDDAIKARERVTRQLATAAPPRLCQRLHRARLRSRLSLQPKPAAPWSLATPPIPTAP